MGNGQGESLIKGLRFAGTPAEKHTRINGPLKHVWRALDQEGDSSWQNVKKPPVKLKEKAEKEAEAPQQ